MGFFNAFLKRYWSLVLNGILLVMLIFTTCYFLTQNDTEEVVDQDSISCIEAEEENTSKIYVDIKGAVKTPGVYKMSENSIIDDAIKEAGGFTKKAYTRNINLSKVLSNEMVIIVYTQSEYKELNKEETLEIESNTCVSDSYNIDSCIQSGNSVISTDNSSDISNNNTVKDENKEEIKNEEKVEENTNNKISINKATKEELMKLNGIGESKAEGIIKYREENSGFKSIEEIKNVSGIGDAAYEKIKDYITI